MMSKYWKYKLMKHSLSIPVNVRNVLKRSMLSWSIRFDVLCWRHLGRKQLKTLPKKRTWLPDWWKWWSSEMKLSTALSWIDYGKLRRTKALLRTWCSTKVSLELMDYFHIVIISCVFNFVTFLSRHDFLMLLVWLESTSMHQKEKVLAVVWNVTL